MSTSIINPSICIPRIENHINKNDIYNTFSLYNFGKIDRIDLITTKNKQSQRAFIHFKYWYNTFKSNIVKNYLLNDKDVKIIYDEPWFWKCFINKAKK